MAGFRQKREMDCVFEAISDGNQGFSGILLDKWTDFCYLWAICGCIFALLDTPCTRSGVKAHETRLSLLARLIRKTEYEHSFSVFAGQVKVSDFHPSHSWWL